MMFGDDSDDEPEVEHQCDDAEQQDKLFCRFKPWQLDRFASALLGEVPLCEKWISNDGKFAILWPLELAKVKPQPDYAGRTAKEMAEDLASKWKSKFSTPKQS